jgi:hypothetical protein
VRERLLALMMAVGGGMLSACASAPSSDTTGLERLDVTPGQTLIVPMDDSWPLTALGRVTGWLDTGERVQATVHRLSVHVDIDPTQERAARWLAPSGVWTSGDKPKLSPEHGDQVQRSMRVLAVNLPASAPRTPRVLRVLERNFAIQFLASAQDYLQPSSDSTFNQGDPWAPTYGTAGAVSPILTALAWSEALSPIGRWRFRMMSGTLRPELDPPPFDLVAALTQPAPPAGEDGVGGLQPFEDPVIEALASQYDSRWRVALAKLWATDPELTGRVKRRLAGVVDFGNGYVAPAWPTDLESIDTLLRDILDPSLDAAQRLWRAEAWLNMQPAAVAWVVDDAGTVDGLSGGGIGAVAVANLTDVSTLAWVSTLDNQTASLSPLPAHASRRLAVEPARVAPESTRPAWRPIPPTTPSTHSVNVHAGRWRDQLTLVHGRVPATPPSQPLGPLLDDYTMATWLTGKGVTSTRSVWLTATMLHRVGSSDENTRPCWELFVECLTPRPTDAPESDVVRVWIGPLGAPLAVFRVDGEGKVADEARRPDLVPTPGDARVVRSVDRWSFRLVLPDRCIESDGSIRLGLTRTDPTGSRSAWPRPMLPWQDEPGRLAIDTTKWEESEE